MTAVRLSLDQGITGLAAREQQPILVRDVTAEPHYIARSPNTRSEMAAPLIAGEQVIGVVNVESLQPGAFTEEDLRLLATLAGQLAVIFEKACLDAELEAERVLLAQRVAERTAELSESNAALARASRAKDEFLAAMSHELRTPLTSILGMADALQEQIFGPLNEKQLNSVRIIGTSGHHLLSLINDILDLSKIEAGKLTLQPGPVHVELACQLSLQFVKQAALEKRIEISTRFDNNVQIIQADERRLKQILINLLSNAVKFTPEGGSIGLEVTGDVEQQVVHFTVWDTGIGIAPQDMGRLFKPFVQLDSSLSRQYSGTGLGLSLVHRLTEMHGGSVSVQSEVGQGSRFTVSLPWSGRQVGKEKVDKETSDATLSTLSLSTCPPATILLAEDNESNIATISGYLTACGFEVIVARNGAEAIERAREHKPDAILMDIQMPGMDGLEAIRRIRAEGLTMPIIAATALAMPGDRDMCLQAGANDYMSKPLNLKKLAETLRPLGSSRP